MMKVKNIIFIAAGASIIAGTIMTAAAYSMEKASYVAPAMKTEQLTDTASITKLDIKPINDVKILPHDDNSIIVEYYANNCSISADGSTAEICISDNENIKWYDYINISFDDQPSKETIIYIPSSLNPEISVEASFGGNTVISDINGSSLNVSSAAGSTAIMNSAFSDVNITGSYSDISVKNTTVQNIMTISNDAGDTDISDSSFGNLECSNNYGDIELANTDGSAVINNNCGDIDIHKISGENLKLTCDYGDISGTVSGNERDYKITASAALGNCNLVPKADGKYSLEASAECGDISIDFE